MCMSYFTSVMNVCGSLMLCWILGYDLMLYWCTNLCVLLCDMNASKNISLRKDNHNACWSYLILKLIWVETKVRVITEARKHLKCLFRVREVRSQTFAKVSKPNKRSALISPKGLMNLHEGRLGKIIDMTTISGCRILVPASPHTASGETSIRALWIDAERVSSVGIFLVS